jgi:hypothetical protein
MPATKNDSEACEVLHLQHGIIIMSKNQIDDSFTHETFESFDHVKTSFKYFKFTKHCACHAKLPPKPPLISNPRLPTF